MSALEGAGSSRRRFLGMALAGLGGLPLLASCGDDLSPADDGPDSPFDLRALLAGYFGDGSLAAAGQVGRVYAETYFAGDTARLQDDLDETLGLVPQESSVDDAIARLELAVIDDFAANRAVSVAGWHLARTEARLCGLVYVTG